MTNRTRMGLGVSTVLFSVVVGASSTARAADAAPAKDKDDESAEPDAKAEPAAPAPAAPAATPANVSLSPEGSPLPTNGLNFKTTFYGFAEFDAFRDSTQSFVDASSNVSIARPNTIPGDNSQTQFTPRNSRIGMKLEAPPWNGIAAAAQAEMDFYGNQSPTATESATYTNAPIRMRHYFLTIKDPIVDVLAGQYHDLFAWGGKGFYPNSVAFLALFGEVYHRNPQLRLSKTISTPAVDVEVALAAVRPVGRVGELPDGQAGVRLAVNGWRGVRAQGSGPPDTGPLQIGVSGVGRRFRVNPFSAMSGDYATGTGWGIAGNIVVPIVPATPTNMRNAVTLTGEVTMGTGIADLYSGLSGGARYPALPNPMLLVPAPVYNANLDPGIVTFDAAGNLKTINWRGGVACLQYHLPIGAGNRVWVSGNGAFMQSTNLASVTPPTLGSTIWTKGYYGDGNLFVAITPAVQADLSYQYMQENYADGVTAKNKRAEFALHYFF